MNKCLIERLTAQHLSDSDLSAVNQLLEVLNTRTTKLSHDQLLSIAENAFVVVARDKEGLVVGMATLIDYRKPSGRVGVVEDVVVARECEGMGLGRCLMNRLIERGREIQLKQIDLTSNPERVRARGLYKSLGFKLRETGCFRLSLLDT